MVTIFFVKIAARSKFARRHLWTYTLNKEVVCQFWVITDKIWEKSGPIVQVGRQWKSGGGVGAFIALAGESMRGKPQVKSPTISESHNIWIPQYPNPTLYKYPHNIPQYLINHTLNCNILFPKYLCRLIINGIEEYILNVLNTLCTWYHFKKL